MKERAWWVGAFCFSFLTLAFFCPGYSERKEVLSAWALAPVIIDGSDEEWGEAAVCFEKKYRVNYGFRNDEKNLYILFQFNDVSYLSSIAETGMTVWLSPEKGKKDYGIRFLKKSVPTETFLNILSQQRRAIPEEEKEQLKQKAFHPIHIVQVIHQKDSPLRLVSNEEHPPARFRSMSTADRVTYEFIFPFPVGKNLDLPSGARGGQIIHVGFEWGGLTEEMKKERLKRLQEKAEQQGAPDARIEEVLRRERTLDTEFNVPSNYFKKYAFWVSVQLARKG